MKLLKVIPIIALLFTVFVDSCKKEEQNASGPKVASAFPAVNTIVSGNNLKISATFSAPMDPSSITTKTFVVKQGATSFSGTVTYSGMTATFTPLVEIPHHINTTATISSGARSSSGQPLAHDYVWEFETCHPPIVTIVNPVNLATCVPINTTISINFSGETDPSTINTSTFTLSTGTTSVAGSVTVNGLTSTFTPTSNLLASTLYTVTITTGVKNYLAMPLENALIWSFTTLAPSCGQSQACGPLNVDLKTAGGFGILAGVGISNVGFSEIHDMNVGISPGFRSSITGFPPGIVFNGLIYAADDIAPPGAIATQAQIDLTNAYLVAEAATSPTPVIISGDLGGRTLGPGIYKSTSTMLLQSGDLTLDAGQAPCDSTAVWIFQVGSALTSVGGTGGNVVLINGAKAGHVFWQIGSSATIGDGTKFKGTLMALTSITLGSGSSVEGRALARNGAVTLSGANIITKP
jgi:hypothetical protein